MDWLYWRRFLSFYRLMGTGSIRDVDWYQPQAIVSGAGEEAVSPLPVANSTAQGSGDFAATIDWLGKKNSIALLVAHKGALRLEHYWPGFSQDTLSEGASMHKSVLALLIGLAIEDGAIADWSEPCVFLQV